ncbi:hypothetical protein F5B22DRAFT_415555 [Xylaria bambusicola]|uniref:uncharacterized protein n=1 Tax=Xylaria bambusicola TaxID=326684 RepID=UPI0020074DD4|nr:uncharacterized protein F5B22DRAFT_415555 [Xylaria bambusicola]KAI0523759.1 hypothetical protein F5B22DRAFT_415555 [Xylaria bambusicola]
MAKKRNKKAHAAANAAPLQQPAIVEEWSQYMGQGELQDFQRLMTDLGFEEHFPSKTKCRQALKTVWVNIPDFLHAVRNGYPVHHFPSQQELSAYTLKTRKFYPKNYISKNSPLRQLLAHIHGGKRGRNNDASGLVGTMGALSLVG